MGVARPLVARLPALDTTPQTRSTQGMGDTLRFRMPRKLSAANGKETCIVRGICTRRRLDELRSEDPDSASPFR